MAHFAKIDENNNVVDCIVLHNDVVTSEEAGKEFIQNVLKKDGTWLQTSYNTEAGEHKLGGTPFRGNFGIKGCTWEPISQVFMPEKPFPSWVISNTAPKWTSPHGDAPELTEEQQAQNTAGTNDWYYGWNEDEQRWDLIDGQSIE